MKKAIAKCSHEDAPELSLPPYRSAYRFTNTMINKGDDIEMMQDMFRKMMEVVRSRNSNSFSPYSSYNSNSHHGDSKMDKMRMMMKMMKMNNMMNSHDDYSSSSYSSDNDMFDMFSDMFDTTHKMDNYRSCRKKTSSRRGCSSCCSSSSSSSSSSFCPSWSLRGESCCCMNCMVRRSWSCGTSQPPSSCGTYPASSPYRRPC